MNTCKVCRSKEIRAINLQLIEGATLRDVAANFGVGVNSLFNHKKNHLPKTLIKGFELKKTTYNGELVQKVEEIEQTKISDSFDIQERFKFLVDETLQIFEIAKKGGQNITALKSLDSLRNTYGLLIQVLDKIEAAKQLELQILKEKKEQSGENQNEQYAKNIQILNTEELIVLKRISNKIADQTDDTIILDGKVLMFE